MNAELVMLLDGAGMSDILIPRKDFIKEHKNLLKVLKTKDPKALEKERQDQAKELSKIEKSKKSKQ